MFVMPACFNAGDTIYYPFDTYDSAGASVTITGLAVTDIEVYKDGSTTQRASDNGYALLDTDGIDFDGSTGLHGFSIDSSDNSDAGFWTDGAQYWVHVNAVTVDGETVRFTYFLPLGLSLRPTTAGRTLDVQSTGEADVNLTLVGGSAVSQSGGLLNANATQISGSSAAADAAESCFTGTITTFDALDTAQDSQHATTQGDISTLSSAVATVDGNVDLILGQTGTTGVVVSALTTAAKAEVNAEADTAMTDYGALKPTVAGRTIDVTTGGAAGIDWANIENQDAVVNLTITTVAGVTAVGSVISVFGLQTGVYNNIADKVLDELLSGHSTAGSLGQAASDILTVIGDLNDLDATAVQVACAASLADETPQTGALWLAQRIFAAVAGKHLDDGSDQTEERFAGPDGTTELIRATLNTSTKRRTAIDYNPS